jgi:hypothetical protein
MAKYKLLKSHYVNGQYLEAGRVVSDEPGGELPPGWTPNLDCEGEDGDGLFKMIEVERRARGRGA